MRFSLFWRLLGVLFLFFTVLRVEFLFWNREIFSEDPALSLLQALVLGWRFDAVSMGWILLPVLLWGWIVRRAYWVPLFLALFPLWVLTVIDIELWNFFGRRMSLSVLKLFREADGAMAQGYFFWIALACVIAAPFFYQLFKICWKAGPFSGSKKRVVLEQIGIVLILVLMTRGGWQKKPLTPVNAHLFEKAHLNQLVLNTSFTLLKSLKGSGLQKEKFFESYGEALKLVNGSLGKDKVVQEKVFSKKQNVVILILESFSWEYTSLNPQLKSEYTPFLNSLMKKSLTFPQAMANGRRSIEGVAAILSGIPALMEEPFITSEFSTNQFEGIGSVFTRKGYDTSFYHGGDNGTMHFDAFTERAGFRSYFGSREYPHSKDHDGVWGIWDRPYLNYYVDELSKKPEPFLSVLFTLSSHQPYNVPVGEAAQFPEREHPILKAISYADSSLQDFFKKAEKEPWYPDTLFIILADHTGPIIFHRQETPLVAYRIPILFYHPQIPSWPAGIDREQLAQQIDIPASLYDFMNFEDVKTIPLSRSIFRPGPKHFTAFASGIYWQTDGNKILTQQGKNQSYVLSAHPNEATQADPLLEKQLKAVREVFSFGLWDNALYGQ